MRAPHAVLVRCERIIYRICGLPVCLAGLLFGFSADDRGLLRHAFADHYWHPYDAIEWLDISVAVAIWPVGLLLSAIWYTVHNGAVVRNRCGRPRLRQFLDQLRLYWTAGVLPPWYYIFSLHDGPTRDHANSFLHRYETKKGLFKVLADHRRSQSPLGDKFAFAEFCQLHQVPAVPVIAVARHGQLSGLENGRLPDEDLFLKPVRGRGGNGAERWDLVIPGRYRAPHGVEISSEELQERLVLESWTHPRIVQPRVTNCAELNDINNGALSTVRVLTCLDEEDRPEVIAAVLRMAVGANSTVDNFHAGGVAANVDLETGVLGPASNLGKDANLGWWDCHPNSGAQIRGRQMPQWNDICRVVVQAHRAFGDRVMIGWDIAATPEGVRLIEGNSGPDVDIMQRLTRRGLMEGRCGQLLAHHVRLATALQPYAAVSMPSSPSLR
jgi:hypothetical protein